MNARKRKNEDHFWLIAYIDSTYISRVTKELSAHEEYSEVEAYIPTVRVLKKVHKGKTEFEEIPLLFNYGFFKVPKHLAVSSKFLESLKKDVSCIYAWVKDPAKVISNKPKLRGDKKSVYEYTDSDVWVATAPSEDIAEIAKNSKNYSTHDAQDLKNYKPGDTIILRGYPFDGLEAQIVEINEKKEEVKVKIQIFDYYREAVVSFDNVFFTVYRSHDDSVVLAGSLSTEAKVNMKSAKDYKNDSD